VHFNISYSTSLSLQVLAVLPVWLVFKTLKNHQFANDFTPLIHHANEFAETSNVEVTRMPVYKRWTNTRSCHLWIQSL